MTCKEIADFLMDYIEQTLPGEQLSVFEGHLKVCADCRRYLDGYRKTISIGKVAMILPASRMVPEELIQAILAARSAGR